MLWQWDDETVGMWDDETVRVGGDETVGMWDDGTLRLWGCENISTVFEMICATAKDAETKYGVDLIVKKGKFILNIYITYLIILLNSF